jgi:hypothetical protein
MADNWRSKLITAGVARSPNRAMLRAVDFKDGDFEKPIVGVANGHSNMNPCNAGIQPLVDRAMRALREAGAMPQVFGTPTVTDGIGMGTDGMKYSLVSREVIADAIETAVNGQMMDGALVIGACDKNMPGGMMAMARMNVPAIYVYGGTIKPGNWKGQALTIASAFEAVGAFSAGKLSQEDFDGIEKNACPTVGACGGMFTANTMSSSFEALGLSLLGSSQLAATDPEKAAAAADVADHGGDHGQEDQGRRRVGDPLRGSEGRAGHAGNAVADFGADRPGTRRLGRPAHRRPFLGRDLGHSGRPCRAGGLHRRQHCAGEGGRLDHHRRAQANDPAQRARPRTGQAPRRDRRRPSPESAPANDRSRPRPIGAGTHGWMLPLPQLW